MVKIDVQDGDTLNENTNNNKKGIDMSLLDDLKNVVGELTNKSNEVQQAVEAVASAPNVEQAIVEAVIAALEAQGYKVLTPEQVKAEEAGNQDQSNETPQE